MSPCPCHAGLVRPRGAGGERCRATAGWSCPLLPGHPGPRRPWVRVSSCLPIGGSGLGEAPCPQPPAPTGLCSLPSRSRALGGEDRDLPAVLPAGRLHGGRGCALAHQLHRGLRVPFRPGEQGVGGKHSGCPPPPEAVAFRNQAQVPSTKNISDFDTRGTSLAERGECARSHLRWEPLARS